MLAVAFPADVLPRLLGGLALRRRRARAQRLRALGAVQRRGFGRVVVVGRDLGRGPREQRDGGRDGVGRRRAVGRPQGSRRRRSGRPGARRRQYQWASGGPRSPGRRPWPWRRGERQPQARRRVFEAATRRETPVARAQRGCEVLGARCRVRWRLCGAWHLQRRGLLTSIASASLCRFRHDTLVVRARFGVGGAFRAVPSARRAEGCFGAGRAFRSPEAVSFAGGRLSGGLWMAEVRIQAPWWSGGIDVDAKCLS